MPRVYYIEDLVGRRFGRLVVKARAHKKRSSGQHWHCACDCGGSSTPSGSALRGGHAKSCGCGLRQSDARTQAALNRMKATDAEIIGARFGKLVVIQRERVKGELRWLCLCDCGSTTSVSNSNLKTTISCGCMQRRRYPDPEHSSRATIYGRYKAKAKERGYEWGLSLSDFMRITSQPCAYCGADPELRLDSTGVPTFGSGIDRVDNNEGYVEENVVPCCTWCNIAKNNRDVSDFTAKCLAVVRHLGLDVA